MRKLAKRSKSLSSTIPSEVVKILGAEEGDDLNWIVEVIDNNLQIQVDK